MWKKLITVSSIEIRCSTIKIILLFLLDKYKKSATKHVETLIHFMTQKHFQ